MDRNYHIPAVFVADADFKMINNWKNEWMNKQHLIAERVLL